MKLQTQETAAPAHVPAAAVLTSAYLAALFLGLPLVYHDGYFDVTEAKYVYFLAATAAYLLGMLACALVCRKERVPAARRGPTLTDGCMLAYALLLPLSSLLSGRLPAALFSPLDRYQGIVTVLLYAAMYFCVSRSLHWTRLNDIALALGCALSCLVALLNAFSLDPLRIRAALPAWERARYVSTVGNIDFFGAYLAAAFPFLLCRFAYARSRADGLLFGGTLLFAAPGVLLAGCESFFLAFAASLLLLPLLCGDSRAARRALLAVGALLPLLCALLPLLPPYPDGLYVSYWMRALLRPYVALPLAALYAAPALLLKTDASLPAFRRAYGFSLLILAALGALFLLLCNTALRSVPLGALDRFVKFGANWGTDRGRIWARCAEWFARYPLWQKLLGGGSGAVYLMDAPAPLFPDAVMDSAHNEYLHLLLTAGVLGLAAYLGLLTGALAPALRRLRQNPLASACALAVLAYAAQAAVNIAQPFSTPLLYAYVAVLAGTARNGGEENAPLSFLKGERSSDKVICFTRRTAC